jgi:osmotically inducible protein OsmC
MADIERTSEATWHGDLRGGNGQITSTSGILKNTQYSFGTRFEQGAGTNPEELLAAAHAACYSMALANHLSKKGFKVDHIHSRATCHLTPQQPAGFKITKIDLVTRGKVEGIDDATFKAEAKEAEAGCIVSNALRAITIELDAALA